jgi:hypothetical protein
MERRRCQKAERAATTSYNVQPTLIMAYFFDLRQKGERRGKSARYQSGGRLKPAKRVIRQTAINVTRGRMSEAERKAPQIPGAFPFCAGFFALDIGASI